MLRTLVPYFGGKRHALPHILPRIAETPHRTYAEPFIGMGGVFLRRPPAKIEAINDVADDVVNLFRVVKYHPEALLDELRLQLVSRSDFQRLLALDPSTLTDIQRAARFVAHQRLCYGGRPASRSFPVKAEVAKSMDAAELRCRVLPIHDRLARVTIEKLDFEEFISRYDRASTLFYLDPPYVGREKEYDGGFARDDFERLAGALNRLKGRFIMSINDDPLVWHLFGRWKVQRIEFRYTVIARMTGSELLIAN